MDAKAEEGRHTGMETTGDEGLGTFICFLSLLPLWKVDPECGHAKLWCGNPQTPKGLKAVVRAKHHHTQNLRSFAGGSGHKASVSASDGYHQNPLGTAASKSPVAQVPC